LQALEKPFQLKERNDLDIEEIVANKIRKYFRSNKNMFQTKESDLDLGKICFKQKKKMSPLESECNGAED